MWAVERGEGCNPRGIEKGDFPRFDDGVGGGREKEALNMDPQAYILGIW